MTALKVEQLLTDPSFELGLVIVAGRAGIARRITVPRIQKPGLALTGFTEQLHPERVQVLGKAEIGYLAAQTEATRRTGLDNLIALNPACLVITRGLAAPPHLVTICEERGVALLTTPLSSSLFVERITKYLEQELAAATSVHGVLMDVLGVGILLLGKSGIGKSEAALDLVMRGHRLVADDIVDVKLRPPDTIFGSGSEIIKHHMEIRGLGIINIKDLFGVAAVRDTKKIELVMELVEWTDGEEYERLGVDDDRYSLLGIDVPHVRVPVRPGRSISSIIEVAARNQLLKFQGHFSARDFQDRLNRAIAEARPRDIVGDEVE